MTAQTESLPKIVLGLGAPDGMSGQEATERFRDGDLQGVSGITSALAPWLRERAHPFAMVMFGTTARLDAQRIRRLHEQTRGQVLVNLICEADLQRLALRQVARYELETQLPVLNPSWAVNGTTRALIARRLAGQAGVRAPRCTLFRAGGLTLAEHIDAHRHAYPVLLRPPGEHGSFGLVRVDDPAGTGGQTAPQSCTVTDFVDVRSADGLWRKYRLIYAGGRLFRRHVLIGRDWNVMAQARRLMRERPDLVAEEQAWLARPVTLEPGSVEARVLHQFRALQLDFGAIDFALPPGGDLVVFEINACVQLANPEDTRATAGERYYEANSDEILHALLDEICRRAAAR